MEKVNRFNPQNKTEPPRENSEETPTRGRVFIANRLRKESVRIDREGRIISRKIEIK